MIIIQIEELKVHYGNVSIRSIGESWGMANTFLLGLINATYMHDLKSLVYNHKEQVGYY